MPRGRKNTIDDFWKQVDVRGHDECWPWLGSRTPKGYGNFGMDGKNLGAHRVALSTVQDVPDETFVLHTCDNPPCVNPAHLSVGTAADNARDRDKKGRRKAPKGETHVRSKLTESEAFFIRYSDIKQQELARIFGVDETTISNIKAGRRWKHVP